MSWKAKLILLHFPGMCFGGAYIDMIKKTENKWVVFSEKAGKSLGSYNTHKEAKKRLGQVEFFKRLKQTRGIKEGRKGRR